MNIKVLSKLLAIKKQEINVLKNDFLTLDQIVSNLKSDYEIKLKYIDDFIQEAGGYLSNENVDNMLGSRIFLQTIYSQQNIIQNNLQKAEKQKDAAFDCLKTASLELKTLEKVQQKMVKAKHEINLRLHQSIADELAINHYGMSRMP